MTLQEANPYEVLQIDPSTSQEQAVRAAARLKQQASDENVLTEIRQAVQSLTGNADTQRLHRLLTHAKPCYEWPALHAFLREFGSHGSVSRTQ